MNWIDTPSSSNVSRFCYLEDQQMLVVEFKNGATYNYYDVPEHVYEAMRNAGSVGQFLATQVKGNFRYARA